MDNKYIRFVVEVIKGRSVENLKSVEKAALQASGAVDALTTATSTNVAATDAASVSQQNLQRQQHQTASSSNKAAQQARHQAQAQGNANKAADAGAAANSKNANSTLQAAGATEAYNRALLENAKNLAVVQDQTFLTQKGLQRFANRQADANLAMQAANNNLGKFYTTLGKIESMGTPTVMRASTWAALGAGGVIYKSVKLYTDLNSQIQQIINQAGRPVSEEGFLTKESIQIAKDTGAAIHDVANAMYRAASGTAAWNHHTGATKKQLVNLTRAMVDLNVLGNVPGGAQAEQGARILVSLMNAGIGKYSSSPKRAAAFANAVVGAGDIRQAEMIAASSKGLFTAAKINKLSLPDVFAYADLLTSLGQTGATAGTAVKSAVTLLGQNPSVQGTTALGMVGIKPGDMQAWIKSGGLGFAGQQLMEHMKKFQPVSTFPRYAGAEEGAASAEKLFAKWTLGTKGPKGFMQAWKRGLDPKNAKDKEYLDFIQGQLIVKAFGGSKQMVGVATLLQNLPKFMEFYNRIKEQSTLKVYDASVKRAENAPGRKISRMWIELQGVMIDLGKKLTPTVITIGDGFVKLIKAITKFKEIFIPIVAMIGGAIAFGAAAKVANFAQGGVKMFGASSRMSANVWKRLGENSPGGFARRTSDKINRRYYKSINAYESGAYRSTTKKGEDFLAYAPGAWQNSQQYYTRDLSGSGYVYGGYSSGGGGGGAHGGGGGGGGGGAHGGGSGGSSRPYSPGGGQGPGVNSFVPIGNFRGTPVGRPGSIVVGGGAANYFNTPPRPSAAEGMALMDRNAYNLLIRAEADREGWNVRLPGNTNVSTSPSRAWIRRQMGIPGRKHGKMVEHYSRMLRNSYDSEASLNPHIASRLDWLDTNIPVYNKNGEMTRIKRLGDFHPEQRYRVYSQMINRLPDDQRAAMLEQHATHGFQGYINPNMPDGKKRIGIFGGMRNLANGAYNRFNAASDAEALAGKALLKQGASEVGRGLLSAGGGIMTSLLGFLGGPIGMTMMTSLLPVAVTALSPVISRFLGSPKPATPSAPHSVVSNEAKIKEIRGKIAAATARIAAGTGTSHDFKMINRWESQLTSLTGETTDFKAQPLKQSQAALTGIRNLRSFLGSAKKNRYGNGQGGFNYFYDPTMLAKLPKDVRFQLATMGLDAKHLSQGNAKGAAINAYLQSTIGRYKKDINSPAFSLAMSAINPSFAGNVGVRNLASSQFTHLENALGSLKGDYWKNLKPGQAKQKYYNLSMAAAQARKYADQDTALSQQSGITEEVKNKYIALAAKQLARSKELSAAATKVAQENNIKKSDARVLANSLSAALEATFTKMGISKKDFTQAFVDGISNSAAGLASIVDNSHKNIKP